MCTRLGDKAEGTTHMHIAGGILFIYYDLSFILICALLAL